MARKEAGHSSARNPFQRAAASVMRIFSRRSETSGSTRELASRNGDDLEQPIPVAAENATSSPRRTVRREADIPMDRIANEYLPTQTSLKSSFRSDGADLHRDQDYARGVADDRWNDEDHLTNRSGDPRIGTHGRSYEPGERRES